MEKIHENMHIFVLSCKFKHESTKTCTFPCKVSFSVYFYPTLHHNGKVLMLSNSRRHGDSLAIVASQQLRERALWPEDKDPCIEITDVQYCLLEVNIR